MDTTVKQLIDRFNDGNATPQERLALLQMVQNGQHADLFGDALEARILYFLERPHLIDITAEDERIADRLQKASRQAVYRHAQPRTASLLPYWSWAAAAAVLIFVATAFYFYRHNIVNDNPTVAAAWQPTAPISTHIFNGRQWLHLPDGTTVLLNDNSQLQYDSTFNINTRTVTLIGEAYFDVKHDIDRPFHVRSGAIDTQVLGTAFNVKAFPDQKNITVTVSRGSVKVSDARNTQSELAIITPKHQLSVNASDTRVFATKTVEPEKAVTWRNDFLVFNDIAVNEAATLIENKYQVHIEYKDEAFKQCRIDAAFIHGESLEQVLTVVSKVFHGSYTMQGNIVTIAGSCQ